MTSRPIPSLDGLRAFSVLLVILSHIGVADVAPGGFGVTVFFFLSGFLITTLMRSEYEATGSVNLRHFWLRRALRILPPFYLVLVVCTVASWLVDPPGTLSPAAVVAQVLHYTNYWIVWNGYSGQAPGTGVYWSLAVEEHFYLLFPWLYVALRRLRLSGWNQALLLWGICGVVLVWRCVLVGSFDVPEDRTYLATDTRVDAILFGCALAVWRNPVVDANYYPARLLKFALLPAAIAILLGTLVYRDPGFRETFRYSLQGIALTVVFVACIRFHDEFPFRLLNLRPVVFIGVLSYSLYLVHYPLIFAVERLLPDWPGIAQACLAGALSFGTSWTIYRFVEKPCGRLRKKLSGTSNSVAA